MAVKTFTTGEVLTASDTNTYLNNGGLVAIVPSSVTNGSIIAGTASATVSATQPNVVLKGVFSSTFDGYRVVISNLTLSGTGYTNIIYARMHDGTNPSNVSYAYGVIYVDQGSGTLGSDRDTGGTVGVPIGRGNNSAFNTSFDVLNPFTAAYTTFAQLNYSNGYNGFAGAGGGVHAVATSYSALYIAPLSGTMTGGTITVYGYRK
jgi:hypothetical protein